jgi:hypothetical protein
MEVELRSAPAIEVELQSATDSSVPSRCGGNDAEEHKSGVWAWHGGARAPSGAARMSASSSPSAVEEAREGGEPATRRNPCGRGHGG